MVLMMGPRAASTGKNVELRARRRISVLMAKTRQTNTLWFMLKWLLALANSMQLHRRTVDSDFKPVRLRVFCIGIASGPPKNVSLKRHEHRFVCRKNGDAQQ